MTAVMQLLALYDRLLRTAQDWLVKLTAENVALKARIAELEKTLGAATPAPSTPSGAIPPYQKENVGRRKRKKKPGRKHGHPGSGRKTPQHIDRTAHHRLEVCPDCQNPVSELPTPRRRVTQGLPEQRCQNVEHLIWRAWCRHCRKIVEPKVVTALPKSMLSLRTVVEAAWMHYLVGVSLSNVVESLRLRGLLVTAGGLTQSFATLAQLLVPYYDQVLHFVKNAAVLSGDETSWRISGVTYWLWYFGTRFWSYYLVDRHRGKAVVQRVLGSILSGILLCDFWAAYNFLRALAKQRCMFHLLTELDKVDLRNSSPAWQAFRKTLGRLIGDAIRLAAAHRELDAKTYARRKARVHARLDALRASDVDDKDARRLLKRLRRHRSELFVFLDHPETVSPYNNHAEQQMRPPVQSRRISHGNRSEAGARTQAILMTLMRSCRLQSKHPIDELIRLTEAVLKAQPLQLEDPGQASVPVIYKDSAVQALAPDAVEQTDTSAASPTPGSEAESSPPSTSPQAFESRSTDASPCAERTDAKAGVRMTTAPRAGTIGIHVPWGPLIGPAPPAPPPL